MCRIFAIFGHEDAARIAGFGIHAQQHGGEDAAGIVVFGPKKYELTKSLGLVDQVLDISELGDFSRPDFAGDKALAHVRYTTEGTNSKEASQPFVDDSPFGTVGLAHNGNLTNLPQLREVLERRKTSYSTDSDSEAILAMLVSSEVSSIAGAVYSVCADLQGAYALTIMTKDTMIGVRDPSGCRPLVLGRLNQAWVLASETCAFDVTGVSYVREVQPGEMVVVTKDGLRSELLHGAGEQGTVSRCIFELIYFSHPSSRVTACGTGEMEIIRQCRLRGGRTLAAEELNITGGTVPGDIVVPVLASGAPAARGYAQACGLHSDAYQEVLVRNHYVSRTFIKETQDMRTLAVRLKHTWEPGSVTGKRVIICDDSLVRGTTMRGIIGTAREAGAAEVHVRIASAPIVSPCYYGINMPTKEELIASSRNVQEICDAIGADSLRYLSLDGMVAAYAGVAVTEKSGCGQCLACFTGKYWSEREVAPSTAS